MASEQTVDHIILACPIHRAPRGIMGLIVLDDKQGASSTPSMPSSDLGNTAGWGGQKDKPLGSHPFLVSDLDHRYPAIRRREKK